ncbi:MAG TPA: SDR family NAD(P)-dependent oxidoreductase [Longimicrobium sp.]|nr:SDR family NAD(P)-dependent oxidoreductase [Longimicrobium sp.]
MIDFAGRVALVTGGGRGIGRSTALVLARHGAAVAVVARSTREVRAVAAEIREAGGRAMAVTADVASLAEVAHAVDAAARTLGPVDLVVNNAGVMPLGAVARSDPAEWTQALLVNVAGAYHTTRAVLPAMLARGWGRIVNVSSALAGAAASTHRSAYVTSKAALDRLTVAVAAEVAGSGVTANGVYPGMTDTALQRRLREAPGDAVGPEQQAWYREQHARGRLHDPDAPARLIAALAATTRNGEVIDIDGGEGRALLRAAAARER